MSVIVRSDWARLLAPGLRMYSFERYRQTPEQFPRYVNVRNSTRAYEEDTGISGLGPLAPKGELEAVPFDEPIGLGLVRYIHQAYGLAVAYSREMRNDDQYGIMMRLAAELGRSARYTAELFGHDVYNNGFTSSKYVGRDGQPLFSTAHPVPGTGSTIANKPAVDVDLSQAALEAAIQSFETQVDDRGMPIDMAPRILLVHPLNRLNAKRLLESEFQPGSNVNDINVLTDEGIVVMTSRFLTDPDAWFLLAPPADIDVNFFWREAPDTMTWEDQTADAIFHKIYMRISTGFGDWRGTYGSQGA